jgi:hypothetical protein
MLVEHSRQLAGRSRQLRRLGAPSHRPSPPTPSSKAIGIYDKDAKWHARAANAVSASNAMAASTPDVQITREAVNSAQAALGNGTNLLYETDAKGDELKAKHG